MTATCPCHVPAVQVLVAIPLDRICAGADYRGHNASPTKGRVLPPARSAASLHRPTADAKARAAVEPVIGHIKTRGP